MTFQNTINIVEFCSKKRANYLIKHIDSIKIRSNLSDENYDPQKNAIEYCSQVLKSSSNGIKKEYTNINGKGRLFLRGKQLGFQNMLREYRSFLCIDDYYDLDIKNCQPTILEQYCAQHNISCKQLTKYVNKRELIYEELKEISKDDIKKAFTVMIFGGAKPTFKSKLVNIDKFYIEIKEIQNQVTLLNADWVKYATKKDKLNINGSVTSYVCQEIENNILMTAYNYMLELGFNIGALCFDGLMIRKTKELNKKIIDDLNKKIKKINKYEIEFLIKPFDKTIDVTDDELNKNKMLIIADDLEAVNIVRLNFNNKIIKSNGRFFIRKFDNLPIYEEDRSKNEKETTNILKTVITSYNMFKAVKNSFKEYSTNNAGASQICELFLNTLQSDDKFSNSIWESSLYKIFFKNGYWDFKNCKFCEHDDKIKTTIYVDNDYYRSSQKEIDIVYNKILNPIFADKEHQKYILTWFARGLAGHYEEKTWAVGVSNRDTGKSTITKLFSSSFGNYIGTFNAKEMVSTKEIGGDVAKKLGWCIPFEFTRLNFSNELKTTDENGNNLKLDGEIIKSISSGGDEKKARLNFKDQITFNIQGRMCFFMNQLIDVSPNDAMQKMELFSFDTIFVDELTPEQEKINKLKDTKVKYMKKDSSVNELIKNPKIQMAFINILFDHYSSSPLKKPLQMKEDINEINNDDDDIEKKINNLFEFTQNPRDKITVQIFNDIMMQNKINKSKAKLICQKFGATQNKSGSIRNWIYLKIKSNDDEDMKPKKDTNMFNCKNDGEDEQPIKNNDSDDDEDKPKKITFPNKTKKQVIDDLKFD